MKITTQDIQDYLIIFMVIYVFVWIILWLYTIIQIANI